MAPPGNTVASSRYTVGSWQDLEGQDALQHQIITTRRITVVRCVYQPGCEFPRHFHPQEQITIVDEGELEFDIDGEQVQVRQGEMISIPARVKHATLAVGEGVARALHLFVRSGSDGDGD